jgi:hypothetical protein
MAKLREYKLELVWLALVILLFAGASVEPSAADYNWEDAARDCSSSSGWCELAI